MPEDLVADMLSFVSDEVAMTDDELTLDTDLLLGGVVDSLGVIRLTHWLEERTGRAVPPGDVTLENFQTVSAIAAYVERTSAPTVGS